jgi:hypothetical protein
MCERKIQKNRMITNNNLITGDAQMTKETQQEPKREYIKDRFEDH